MGNSSSEPQKEKSAEKAPDKWVVEISNDMGKLQLKEVTDPKVDMGREVSVGSTHEAGQANRPDWQKPETVRGRDQPIGHAVQYPTGANQFPPNYPVRNPTSPSYNQPPVVATSGPPPFNSFGPQANQGQPVYQGGPIALQPNVPYFHHQQGMPPHNRPAPPPPQQFPMQPPPPLTPQQFPMQPPPPLMMHLQQRPPPRPLFTHQQPNPSPLGTQQTNSGGFVQSRNYGNRSEYRPYDQRKKLDNRINNGNKRWVKNDGDQQEKVKKQGTEKNKTKDENNGKVSDEKQSSEKHSGKKEKKAENPPQRGHNVQKCNRARQANLNNLNNGETKEVHASGEQRRALSKNNKGPNDILMNFIGENIPSLPEALCLSIDIGTKVEGVILVSDVNSNQPELISAKTLLHIVEYKLKHPNAKSVLV